MVNAHSSQGPCVWPLKRSPRTTSGSAGVANVERAVRDRHAVTVVGQADGRALVLRVERHPAIEFPAPGRRRIPHQAHREGAVLWLAGILDLDAQNVGIGRRQELTVTFHIPVRIKQRAEWRIADRPALQLIHLVVDQRQRAAIRYDNHVDALLVFEANTPWALES